MPSSWMLQRFRSAWLTENMPMLILRFLRDSSMTEWEILSRLHDRYELTPTRRQFTRVEKSLVAKGFASMDVVYGKNRLTITKSGMELLLALEREYRNIATSITQSRRSFGERSDSSQSPEPVREGPGPESYG